MLGLKRVVIGQHERGLMIKHRSIKEILEPGIYWFFDLMGNIEIEIYDITQYEFTNQWATKILNDNESLRDHYFHSVKLTDYEVGYIFVDYRLSAVIPPATQQLYWRGPEHVEIKIQNIKDDYKVLSDKTSLLANNHALQFGSYLDDILYRIEIVEQQVGLLFIDGQLVDTLKPGVHAFWKFHRNIRVELIELRLQAMDVSGQEILTKDKVSLRINLAANYQIVDPVLARNEVTNITDFLYRELQFAIREAIGTQHLDALLTDKGQLDTMIFSHVKQAIEKYGVRIVNVGVKDIILPGDMKSILNEVVQTEKAAQANVIKRREETAATRSLLNTAKLMANNPLLLRMKELETLEKVTDKIERLTVFGGLDGILQELVSFNPSSTQHKI